ncbi:hypothetical protein O8B39_11725 [Agrobacterium rhizogenes]|nr:hypothetical protein [Rhizobium rhizogenes]
MTAKASTVNCLAAATAPLHFKDDRAATATGSSPDAEFQQKSFGSEIIIGIVFAAPIPRRGYRRDEQRPACGKRAAQAKTSTKVKPNGK